MANGSKVKDAAGDVGTAKNLPASLVQRVAQGVKFMVTGATPDGWFGPMQPLQPVAQEQAEGRVLDYQTGYNQRTQPREDAAISFQQLRNLADACEVVRLAIETRKDQIARLNWNIKLRDTGKPVEDAPNDPRIAAVESFLRYPDLEHDWPTWLRMVVEDLLVTDAPAIYRRRDQGGKLYALNVVDGTLIKRVIDEFGLTPAPPSPAYQLILHGLPAADYTTEQLFYLPRNPRSHRLYGYSPVEQIVMTVNIALRRSVSQLNWYTEGNIPEALISCPTDWRPPQIKEMQEIFDDMLAGDLAARSGAKFIPGGLNVQFTKDALLKDDFDEWLARIVCFAFSLPPTAFVKQMNRATADSEKDRTEQEGLAPLQMWVKNMMDRVLAEDFGSPDLEFTWYDDTSTDPLQLAQVNNIYVNSGVKTRNEVRGALGLDPIPDGDAITITAGNTVTRLSDALSAPEPAAAPTVDGTARSPPQENDNEKSTKQQVTKVEDPDDDATPAVEQHSDEHEAELTAILANFFRRQRERIAAKLAGTEHTPQTLTEALAEAEQQGALDADALVDPVEQVLAERALRTSQDELASVQASVGISEDEAASPLVNQEAVDYAHSRAAELVGRKLVDGKLVDNPNANWAITDTTREALKKLVKDAAEMIAQTELSFADGNGNLIAWKASGVVAGKNWLLGNEHMICDQCDTNAKVGVIPLADAFPSGHRCTPAHPRCSCGMAPVIGKPR